MRVKGASQVVHDPLADTGGEGFLRVETHRVEQSEGAACSSGKFQVGKLVLTNNPNDEVVQPAMHWPRAQHIIKHNLERPGLKQVGGAFSRYCNQANQDSRR